MSKHHEIPEPQELVTGGEIARRLGVSRERVRQLTRRPDFPQPLGRLGAANVWTWEVVNEWRQADHRPPPVEIWSWTDPPHVRDRKVWYQTRYGELQFDPYNDYQVVLAEAERLRREQDTVLIDRSDRGSGLLLATLDR